MPPPTAPRALPGTAAILFVREFAILRWIVPIIPPQLVGSPGIVLANADTIGRPRTAARAPCHTMRRPIVTHVRLVMDRTPGATCCARHLQIAVGRQQMSVETRPPAATAHAVTAGMVLYAVNARCNTTLRMTVAVAVLGTVDCTQIVVGFAPQK